MEEGGGEYGESQPKKRTKKTQQKRRKKECGCGQNEMTECASYNTCVDMLRFRGDSRKLLLFQFFCLFFWHGGGI